MAARCLRVVMQAAPVTHYRSSQHRSSQQAEASRSGEQRDCNGSGGSRHSAGAATSRPQTQEAYQLSGGSRSSSATAASTTAATARCSSGSNRISLAVLVASENEVLERDMPEVRGCGVPLPYPKAEGIGGVLEGIPYAGAARARAEDAEEDISSTKQGASAAGWSSGTSTSTISASCCCSRWTRSPASAVSSCAFSSEAPPPRLPQPEPRWPKAESHAQEPPRHVESILQLQLAEVLHGLVQDEWLPATSPEKDGESRRRPEKASEGRTRL